MTTEFLTKAVFTSAVEKAVLDKKMSYMDAVVKYCGDNDIDTASVGPLVNKVLKEKIKEEAENLNLVEKSSTAILPL